MSENKEMPLKRREIWCESMEGRKDEEERSAEEGRYDINTQMKGNPRGGEGRGKLLTVPCSS